MEESEIFGGSPQIIERQTGFHDFKLLKANAKTRLYLAHKSGKRFVIKTTKDESELQKKILQREYELSIDCDHPNLVHIYTLEEGFPFGVGLVMEYIEGVRWMNISKSALQKKSVIAFSPNSFLP